MELYWLRCPTICAERERAFFFLYVMLCWFFSHGTNTLGVQNLTMYTQSLAAKLCTNIRIQQNIGEHTEIETAITCSASGRAHYTSTAQPEIGDSAT